MAGAECRWRSATCLRTRVIPMERQRLRDLGVEQCHSTPRSLVASLLGMTSGHGSGCLETLTAQVRLPGSASPDTLAAHLVEGTRHNMIPTSTDVSIQVKDRTPADVDA